jgi:chromosome segregation ATPase
MLNKDDNGALNGLKTIVIQLWSFIKQFFTMKHLLTVCATLVVSRFIWREDLLAKEKASKMELDQLRNSVQESHVAVQTLSHRLNIQRQVNEACTRHNSQLQIQLNKSEEALQKALATIEQLQNDIIELQEQLTKCRERISDQSTLIKELKDSVQRKEENIRQLDQQLAQQQKELHSLKEKEQALQNELREKEKKLNIAQEREKVFEYVLNRTSPDLARTLIQELNKS